MGQTDEAIRSLAAIDTPDARRLKVDVLWQARRWGEAAKAISILLPSPAPAKLNDEEAKLVVNMAVASKLAGDTAGLEDIKARYSPVMAGTPMASTFGVVTRAGGLSTLSDRDTLLKMAGEVDMFKGFLDSYKAAGGKTTQAAAKQE
jgi:hypothetical protein